MGEERRQCARAWLVSDAELRLEGDAGCWCWRWCGWRCWCALLALLRPPLFCCHVSDPLATVFFTGREETEDLHVLRTLLPGAIIPIHTAALSPHPAGDTG